MRKKYDIDDILEKGEELLRQQGYNNTGIEDILKACGIPKGSFYNFFKSKEDFGVKALDHYGDKQYEFVSSILINPNLSPLQRLKQFYNTVIGVNVSENCKYGCLVGNLSQEMGGINDNIGLAADRNFKRIIKLIETCVAEAQEAGEVRNDFPADELADYLHTSFYGALVRSKAGQNPQPFTHFSKMAFEFLELK